MKKSVYIVAALCLLLSVCAGCGGETTALASVTYPESIAADDYEALNALQNENSIDDSIVSSVSGFSAKSASEVLSGTTENACYSPMSLYMALAVLSTGAQGDTQDELLALLGEEDTAYLSEQMGMLYRLTYRDNDQSKFYMTNSLWMNQTCEFKQDFIDNAQENFYAAANTLDFSDEVSGETISNWISDNTNNLIIPDIEVDTMDLMYIINTVYQKDEWMENFEEDATEEGVFTLADGSGVNAQFMNNTVDSVIINGDGFTATSLQLKNTGKMTFVLPDEGVDVDSLLTQESIAKMLSAQDAQSASVTINLPKFNFDTKLDLKESLKSLGVEKAFKENADLKGIADVDAFVSEVKQESNISINENGIEAAAYTEIAISLTGEPIATDAVELTFDRPFIFIVQSNENIPVFIGVVQNPLS